jgi:DNA-binding Xre family transcriptional regulator
MVKMNVKQLVQQKAAREGRTITYRDIKAETGINLNTVTALMNDDWSLIGRVTIDRLLDWIDCQPDELFTR